jgi:LysR family transcriptional regulator, glycine cleavage system transcriptional activator
MIHIPSTQALRVFRKAAETLSFTETAEELCLTQSAVSHQIKQLEEQLSALLFVRHRRGIFLSGTGQRFLQAITPILQELETAVASLRMGSDDRQVVVRVESTLLVSVLLPNLTEMLDAIPELRVRFEAADGTPKEVLQDRSIAIYLGQELRGPELSCRSIAGEESFAVCAPSLLAHHPVRSLADLKNHRLLLVRDEKNGSESDWERWLAPDDRQLLAGQHVVFATRALALCAALAGQGIALSDSIPAGPHLVSEQLVRPLQRRVPCADAYYFACPNKLLNVAAIRRFNDWVVARVGSMTQAPGQPRLRRGIDALRLCHPVSGTDLAVGQS